MDDFAIKTEFVPVESIPGRAPLIRKSKWDVHIDKVFKAPPGQVLRVPFGRSIEGARSMRSMLLAAKRRGLSSASRKGDLYLSTRAIPPEILNKVEIAK